MGNDIEKERTVMRKIASSYIGRAPRAGAAAAPLPAEGALPSSAFASVSNAATASERSSALSQGTSGSSRNKDSAAAASAHDGGDGTFVLATLTLPGGRGQNESGEAATSKTRSSWDEVCQFWGMDVVRERVVYVQEEEARIEREGAPNKNGGSVGEPGSAIPVGTSVRRVREQFVISRVRPHGPGSFRSPALSAGLRSGDILVTVGGSRPSPKVLYRLLQESGKLDVTVKRQAATGNPEDVDEQTCVTEQRQEQGVSLPCEGTAAEPMKLDGVSAGQGEPGACVKATTSILGNESKVAECKMPAPGDANSLESSGNGGRGNSARDTQHETLEQNSNPVSLSITNATKGLQGPFVQSATDADSVAFVDDIASTYQSEANTKVIAKALDAVLEEDESTEKAAANGYKNGQNVGIVVDPCSVPSVPLRQSPQSPSSTGIALGGGEGGTVAMMGGRSVRQFWDSVPEPQLGPFGLCRRNDGSFSCAELRGLCIKKEHMLHVLEAIESLKSRTDTENENVSAAGMKRRKCGLNTCLGQYIKAANRRARDEVREENSLLNSVYDAIAQRHAPMALNEKSTVVPLANERDSAIEAESAQSGDKSAPMNVAKRKSSKEYAQLGTLAATQSSKLADVVNEAKRKSGETRDIVSAVPAPSMKSCVLAAGTRITSTSAKAGLSFLKSSKMKRLWPDSSVFRKRVMKWRPPEAVKQGDGSICFRGPLRPHVTAPMDPIPPVIPSAADLLKTMAPHVLEEGRATVNRDFEENSNENGLWTRETFVLTLRSCTPVERHSSSSLSQRMYELGFEVDTKCTIYPPQSVDDLFVVHSSLWQTSPCCIGMIGLDDHNATFLRDQRYGDCASTLFRLWVCVSSSQCEGSGWLAESDLPPVTPDGSIERQKVYALHIGTASNIMRQYEGMKSLGFIKEHLQKAVFCDDLKDRSSLSTSSSIGHGNGVALLKSDHGVSDIYQDAKLPAVNRPSSVPSDIWNSLSSTLNHVQLSAIQNIMDGKAKENVALIQGPPGTGKTKTICGLVTALLNGSCPKAGVKMSGVRVQIGKSISSATGANGALSLNRTSTRILICAASNAAVDELAWRIHTTSIGPDGRVGSFDIVRYGFLPGEDKRNGKHRPKDKPLLYNNERDRYLSKINCETQADASNGRKRSILSRCNIVCATLSGVGAKGFVDAIAGDENTYSEFDVVIIDEACAASEASCLIPMKFNPNLFVMVGDPQQLPAFVASQSSERNMLGRSLFQRLQQNGWPFDLLRIQYRMHDEIVRFPKIFYANKLITSDEVLRRPDAPWHRHMCFPPLLVWNIAQSQMKRNAGGGLSNRSEANFIAKKLIREFVAACSKSRSRLVKIGVVSFYSEQVKVLKSILPLQNLGKVSIEVSTVDGFQGRETDIIIVSCVRSFPANRSRANLGFLQDFRRVNVALTRARESLWIVGNCDYLANDEVWKCMLDQAQQRNLIANANRFEDFVSQERNKQAQHGGKRNNLFAPRKSKKRRRKGQAKGPPPRK